VPSEATFAVDADPSQAPANTAISLGSREACVSVNSGDSFSVDITVTDIADLLGWAASFSYDPSVLQVTAVDVQMFQAANPGSSVIDISDPLPDSDGSYFMGAVDLGAEDTGTGVLARLTLQAVGPGLSQANLGSLEPQNSNGSVIGDTTATASSTGRSVQRQVAVDSLPGATPRPTPSTHVTTIGIDRPGGRSANTATSAPSKRVPLASGQQFTIDLFITNDDLAQLGHSAIQYNLGRPQRHRRQRSMFQAANRAATSQPLRPCPNTSGSFYVSAA
jgi:hypothetical protein